MEFTGERQIAPTRDGIRRDHVARYEWAAKKLPPRSRVVDMACGVGYGTHILAEAGHTATGYDRAEEAIDYARTFYGREGAEYRLAADECPLRSFDAAVCFETIEHVSDPGRLLRSLRGGHTLIASVPNENVIPFGPGFAFHQRHYTREEFVELLRESGWEPREWYGQADRTSEVERDLGGRTMIVLAERIGPALTSGGDAPKETAAEPLIFKGTAPKAAPVKSEAQRIMESWPTPEHVAILGLGPSLEQYVNITKRLGGRHRYCDEVWGINALGGVLQCDRIWHMDDVRIQEIRAKALPDSNIATMLQWLKLHPGPVITSRAHPDYPGLVEFPLQDLLRAIPHPYFNSTAAYAVAYAIYLGVKRISLMGCDYTYPNAHDAERGRACVEFWLGIAVSKGIQISVPKESTLLDAIHTQEERMYGYDTLDLTLRNVDGMIHVDRVEKSKLPTAEEIERRYDHGLHPNEHVHREWSKAT